MFIMDKMKKVKKKKEKWKKIDPPPLGFEPRIFEQNLPAQDSTNWIKLNPNG